MWRENYDDNMKFRLEAESRERNPEGWKKWDDHKEKERKDKEWKKNHPMYSRSD